MKETQKASDLCTFCFISNALSFAGVITEGIYFIVDSWLYCSEGQKKEGKRVLLESSYQVIIIIHKIWAKWIKSFWKNTNIFLCPPKKVEGNIHLVLVLEVMYFCLSTDGLNFV